MSLKIRLTAGKNIFQRFLGVEELDFFIESKGVSIKRFVVTRPEAAAILILNEESGSVVLIRQFRAPVFTKNNDGFIYEVPAGVLDPGEKPEKTIIRETFEETGYTVDNPFLITTFFPSPGVLNEIIHLFGVRVTGKDKKGAGGGLQSEKEFLEVVEIPFNDAIEMVSDGRIVDAKTIIALFYMQRLLSDESR